MMKKYFDRHFDFSKFFDSSDNSKPEIKPRKKNFKQVFQVFVTFLAILPVLCLTGFIFSFFWDFGPRHKLDFWGYELGLESLIRTICVSGIIGFGTNWLAIKMLFRPVVRRPIWGQGLIPAQKDQIVFQLAGGIHQHILSEELIHKRIQESGVISRFNTQLITGIEGLLHDGEFQREIKDLVYRHLQVSMAKPEVRERISTAIDEKLAENLNSGIKGLVFQTYKKLRPKEYDGMISNILDNVPEAIVEIIEEFEKETPKLTSFLKEKQADMENFYFGLVVSILERIDIHGMLSKQMAHLDEAGIEKMIWGATNKQLLYIQYLGTLLGILGGFLIWKPLPTVILYSSTLLILFTLDQILFRFKQRSTKTNDE